MSDTKLIESLIGEAIDAAGSALHEIERGDFADNPFVDRCEGALRAAEMMLRRAESLLNGLEES